MKILGPKLNPRNPNPIKPPKKINPKDIFPKRRKCCGN
jgi:hypothetical protein